MSRMVMMAAALDYRHDLGALLAVLHQNDLVANFVGLSEQNCCTVLSCSFCFA